MISAREALERLKEGNRRFVSGEKNRSNLTNRERRMELLKGQEPFAVVLGCSDSRVPVELIFDQGLGDLFVIRVAGNIAESSQVGTIEFAAERLGARLVVVLGHTRCGAVRATLEIADGPTGELSRNLRTIIDKLRPSVTELPVTETGDELDKLVDEVVRNNIHNTVIHLREESHILDEMVQRDELLVVGAEYSLETGIVDFFDGLP